jgi:hypothetical protein
MKSLRPFIFLLALGIAAGCYHKKTDDPEVLKSVLEAYFDAIKNRDLDQMNAVTTADFILLEDGLIWNNDSLYNFLNEFESYQPKWTFDYQRITIDELSGNIVYLNHGDFIFNDTTKIKYDWLESATFQKIDGNWKMNLLHSTTMK